jgi:hypothetical protein
MEAPFELYAAAYWEKVNPVSGSWYTLASAAAAAVVVGGGRSQQHPTVSENEEKPANSPVLSMAAASPTQKFQNMVKKRHPWGSSREDSVCVVVRGPLYRAWSTAAGVRG